MASTMKGGDMAKAKKPSTALRLVDIHGPTRTWIDVDITDAGDLVFSGQDVGDAPEKFWGDSDYEYWLHISAADKDRVLLALIQKIYFGNSQLVSEFKDFLTSKGIPSKFGSYV
jgi:hypothetical protein